MTYRKDPQDSCTEPTKAQGLNTRKHIHTAKLTDQDVDSTENQLVKVSYNHFYRKILSLSKDTGIGLTKIPDCTSSM